MHVGLALWLPNVVAAAIAAVLVYKITSEQWNSVSEGVFNLISRCAQWARKRRAKTA
jgi:hypothetical protein